MRNRRVNETQKLPLGLGSVIKNLLRNVNEADHCSILALDEASDQTFLDLEELELGNELLVDAFHARKVLDNKI
jgi:predicted GNAT superfamily acetyltransferase